MLQKKIYKFYTYIVHIFVHSKASVEKDRPVRPMLRLWQTPTTVISQHNVTQKPAVLRKKTCKNLWKSRHLKNVSRKNICMFTSFADFTSLLFWSASSEKCMNSIATSRIDTRKNEGEVTLTQSSCHIQRNEDDNWRGFAGSPVFTSRNSMCQQELVGQWYLGCSKQL